MINEWHITIDIGKRRNENDIVGGSEKNPKNVQKLHRSSVIGLGIQAISYCQLPLYLLYYLYERKYDEIYLWFAKKDN